MLFNSWQFAVFFPIVFLMYWLLPHKFRIYILLVSSYYFYMSWNVEYVSLILFTTIISYLSAILIERFRLYRKLILAIALIMCLGVLFVFKYFNFISQSLADFLSLFTIHLHPMTLKLMLPVGISFYTFQTLSYIIDVYRGIIKPEHNFIVYAVFVSFFPQLVAGPIERTNNLLPQIKARHEFNYEQGSYGFKLMALGFFKKIVIADTLAGYVDGVYGNTLHYTGFVLILASAFFMIQIYCDFSGYSDIARGSAKMMGIELMENFGSPYYSSSLHEFWSRWHISLSTWFRDYVYIPLGGSKVGKFRHYFNLMITFVVSGLWHGANWTFVVWGAIHGIGRVLEDILGLNKKRNIFSWLLVLIFVYCSWVFFRANNFESALHVFSHSLDGINLGSMYFRLGFKAMVITENTMGRYMCLLIPFAIYDYLSYRHDVILWLSRKNIAVRWIVYVLFVLLFIDGLPLKRTVGFIYFQF